MRLLSCLKEENVVAGMQVCQTIERTVVIVVRLRIEFRIEIGVWKEEVQVIQQVSVSTTMLALAKSRTAKRIVPERDTTRCQHENAIAQLCWNACKL